MELIRKDKEGFRSARKIPPSGKQPLNSSLLSASRLLGNLKHWFSTEVKIEVYGRPLLNRKLRIAFGR